MKLFAIIVAVIMYAAIIAFPQRKSWASLAAAAVLVLGGAVSLPDALFGLVNWNIILIYIGSLVLADLFIYSRVPAFLADRIVERSPTLGIAIVIILVLTGFISAFVENVATVLVMAPIVIEISRKLKVNPAPFMIGLAVMANLQGTATLVGDPPSMIFASYAGYSFNDFFFHLGKMSIFFSVQVGALAGALYFYAHFKTFDKQKLDLPAERIISWVPTLLLLAMIVGLALVSFLSTGGVHASSGILCIALAVLGILWVNMRQKEPLDFTRTMLKNLDWDTIAFLVGIFIVVGGITNTGVLDDFANMLGAAIGGNVLLGYTAIIVVSVILSGFIDNVPYIIAMLPVASRLGQAMGIAPELYMFGLLLGSCLGGNLTPFGASANVVAIGLSKKAGSTVRFVEWVKLAGPFTVFTTLASALVTYWIWK